MESMKYTIKELKNMMNVKMITCAFCHKGEKAIPEESGINITNAGVELFVATICPEHGHQTNYYLLAADAYIRLL